MRKNRNVPISLTLTQWLQLYRLRTWENKVSNARLLLYAALAYAIAGRWDPVILIFNTLALLGLVMFQGVLNDYWDFRLSGERNFIGSLVKDMRLTREHAIEIFLTPIVFVLTMMLIARRLGYSWWVPALLFSGAILSLAYSVPPIRLKVRRLLGVLIAPVMTSLMFVEAHMVISPMRQFSIGLIILLFLFQLYAELLHLVTRASSSQQEEPGLQKKRAILRLLPAISAAVAFRMALLFPIFWLSVAGSVLRGWEIRRASFERRVGASSPLLSLYEFAGYGVLGVIRLLS